MAATIPTPSDEATVCESLLRSVRQADWSAVSAALEDLSHAAVPRTSAAIHDRARVLEEALTAAKSIRADLAASLVRLTAAAKFSNCQNTGEPAKF